MAGVNAQQIIPRRGEIYLVDFDPAVGSEIQKTRPALVIQNDVGNEFANTTIVAGITSYKGRHSYPTSIPIKSGEGGLNKDSLVLLSQIRTVDKLRLSKKLGSLSDLQMKKVGFAIMISFGFE